MLIIRVYTILNQTAVEVSCVHGATPLESHLVYREQVESGQGLQSELNAAEDVLQRAAERCFHGDLESTDDCGL